jgi:hypothetical protein
MSDATRGSLLTRPVQRRSVPCAASRQIPFAASEGGIEGSRQAAVKKRGERQRTTACRADRARASEAGRRSGALPVQVFYHRPWLDRDRPVPARPGLALIASVIALAPTLAREPLRVLAAGGGASANATALAMFDGQRSAAGIGIESRNERVGSMPRNRLTRPRPSLRRADTTVSHRARRR